MKINYLPSKATVKPETGLPDVKTVNLFSIPAMPLTRPPPCAEILMLIQMLFKIITVQTNEQTKKQRKNRT